jgi:hypothetical protein
MKVKIFWGAVDEKTTERKGKNNLIKISGNSYLNINKQYQQSRKNKESL